MTSANLFTTPLATDPDDPPGYLGAAANLTKLVGATDLMVKLFELPAGQKLCPYHYEYEEEWLLLLSGELDLRTPSGTERLATGAVVAFPKGPDGAHTTSNPGPEPARFVMFSSAREPSVAVYPDSDKVGVWAPGLQRMFKNADGEVPYYDGEVSAPGSPA